MMDGNAPANASEKGGHDIVGMIGNGEYESAYQHLMKFPSDAAHRDRKGLTLMHHMMNREHGAAAQEYPSAWETLFHHLLIEFPEALVCVDNEHGQTPLSRAIWGCRTPWRHRFDFGFNESHRLRFFNLLMTSGVLRTLVEASPQALSMPDFYKMLPLHRILEWSIHFPHSPGNVENNARYHDSVRLILEAYPEAISIAAARGMLPLHFLCEYGTACDFLLFDMIMQAYPQAVHAKDKGNKYPVHLMLTHSHLNNIACCIESLQAMLEANPAVIHQEGNFQYGWTALIGIWDIDFEGHLKQQELLLKVSKHGTTRLNPGESWKMLHAAITFGFCPLRCLSQIMNAFPEQVREQDEDGNLPLALMAECRQFENKKDEQMRLLINAYPDAARALNGKGRLPLHLALENGNNWWDGVSDLMIASPEALSTRDTATHMYPFMLAAVGNDTTEAVSKCFELLRACPEVVTRGIVHAG